MRLSSAVKNCNRGRCLLVCTFIAGVVAPAQSPPKDLRLATGLVDGVYGKLGACLANRVNNHNHTFRLVILPPMKGSVENIRKLESSKADVAFAQSDAAHRAAYGHEPFLSSVSWTGHCS